ncbi:uncharacterized protein LOC144577798 [Callithrix jacchus]
MRDAEGLGPGRVWRRGGRISRTRCRSCRGNVAAPARAEAPGDLAGRRSGRPRSTGSCRLHGSGPPRVSQDAGCWARCRPKNTKSSPAVKRDSSHQDLIYLGPAMRKM